MGNKDNIADQITGQNNDYSSRIPRANLELKHAAPQGGFMTPHVWEIVCRKNLAIFKDCHYSRLYMMISLSFQKIEKKNFVF